MMLYNAMFWLIILGHLIAEFYAQPKKWMELKRKNFVWRLLHDVCYAAIIAVAMLPVAFSRGEDVSYFHVWIAITVAHAVIDCLRDVFSRPDKQGNIRYARLIFFADQLLHAAVIFCVVFVFRVEVGRPLKNLGFSYALSCLGAYAFNDDVRLMQILQWLCLVLALLKPADWFLRMALPGTEGRLLPQEPTAAERALDAAERIIVAFLMMAGQFVAIPIVFVAKAIAIRGASGKEGQPVDMALLRTLANALIAIAFSLFAGAGQPAPVDRPFGIMVDQSANG